MNSERKDCGICKGSHLRLEASAPHPRWEDLSTYILAQVFEHHGTKPHKFATEGHVEFPDDARTQTGVLRLFTTEAEAEAHARHFFDVMRPVWEEAVRTRAVPESPFTRRQRACELHVAGATSDALDAYASAKEASQADPDDRRLRDARYEAKAAWGQAMRDAELAFYQAHPWTEFLEAPAMPAGQLGLFGATS